MNTINIKPVDGRLILMPERGYAPVPKEGATVEESSYYRLAVMAGDIEQVDSLDAPALPPAPAVVQPPAAATFKLPPAADTSAKTDTAAKTS